MRRNLLFQNFKGTWNKQRSTWVIENQTDKWHKTKTKSWRKNIYKPYISGYYNKEIYGPTNDLLQIYIWVNFFVDSGSFTC